MDTNIIKIYYYFKSLISNKMFIFIMNILFKLFEKLYQCPVCLINLKIRYYFLSKCGHLLCYKCSKFIINCPICREELTQIYNITNLYSIKNIYDRYCYIYCVNCRGITRLKGINRRCYYCKYDTEIIKVYFI